jgi:hypothetical protein
MPSWNFNEDGSLSSNEREALSPCLPFDKIDS